MKKILNLPISLLRKIRDGFLIVLTVLSYIFIGSRTFAWLVPFIFTFIAWSLYSSKDEIAGLRRKEDEAEGKNQLSPQESAHH